MQDLPPILRLPIELRLKLAAHVARSVDITDALESCCTQDYFRSLGNDHNALFRVHGFVGLKSRYPKAFRCTNPTIFIRKQDRISPQHVRIERRRSRLPLIHFTKSDLVMTAHGIGPRIDRKTMPATDEFTTQNLIAAEPVSQTSLATLLNIETPMSRLSDLTLVFDTDLAAFNQVMYWLVRRDPVLRLRRLRVCFQLGAHEVSDRRHPRAEYLEDNLLDPKATPHNRAYAASWALRSIKRFARRLPSIEVVEYELWGKDSTSRTVFTCKSRPPQSYWAISKTSYGARNRDDQKFKNRTHLRFSRCEWELIARVIMFLHFYTLFRLAELSCRPSSLRFGHSLILTVSFLPFSWWFHALYTFALQ